MKPDWGLLLDEASLASVMPAEYSHFARPIKEALALFLQSLPAAVQMDMLSSQLQLGHSASISERLGRLSHASPVLQKLGQILARDQRLAPELRVQLRSLESTPPSVPMSEVESILDAELGTLEHRQLTLQPPAIAEASVAVVVPYRDHRLQRDGVLKVLKPGIEERLHCELDLLGKVGEFLDHRCEDLHIPQLDYRDSFRQVQTKLQDEVQLTNEQRHLQQAKAFFSHRPQVQIPELFEHCTSRITAMERIRGVKVTSSKLSPSGQLCRSRLVARSLIADAIFARSDDAMFHGDPHAGNLFWTDDNRLAILDWSLVGHLSSTARASIVQVMLGAMTLDVRHIVRQLTTLASNSRLDVERLGAVVDRQLQRLRHGVFPGMSWLIGMLDDATQQAGLRVDANLMLFRKSLLTLDGVVTDVGKRTGLVDRVMLQQFARAFLLEWPERWIRMPGSRDLPTRLSNFDLARTLVGSPATITRFSLDQTVDLLRLWQQATGQTTSRDGEARARREASAVVSFI